MQMRGEAEENASNLNKNGDVDFVGFVCDGKNQKYTEKT